MEKERAEQNVDSDDESLIESQPLRQSLWDSKVPDNFKSPHLPTFDGKTDHVEHLMAVRTQTAIIGAPEHLRCKLLSGTLKDAALRWYMNLPNNSIESYADFHKKFIHQFSGTKHVKRSNDHGVKPKPGNVRCSLSQWIEGWTLQRIFGTEACHLDAIGLAPLPPPRMHNTIMGADTEAWCAYHRRRQGPNRPSKTEGRGRFGRNKGEKQWVAVNTISGGFAGGGESISARKRYVRKSMFEICSVGSLNLPRTPEISFNPEDARDILPHDDDPLVIQVQILNCDIKRVLINPGSSADILYLDAYKAMHLSDEQLNPYFGTLVGFAGEQVEVMGHITLYTTFGEDENAKTIKVRYLVVKTLFTLYNIIIGRPAFNALGAVMSTLYLSIKYPLNNGKVGVVKGDQPSDMPGIDESIITHKLSISPVNKPMVQRKRKVGEERRAAITEEVAKLKEAGFIEEIKYPTWLANVVMVKKASGKWRMCVDFTDLNKACPKDLYPLPNIDRLIDGASGYKTLSFMDAYSGYNQIKMHPMDAQHTAFMSNICNYFYNVMPFGLKNAGATYQRLIDRVFVEQIGKNLEVYIDDMVVKTQKEGEHDKDLEDILKSVRKYNMRLNPAKCSFGVQTCKFLGFLLTHRGIEENPDKCQAIIDMRSPTFVKEVQLTGRIAGLSRFLSCSGEKACHFFATLRKSEKFTWSPECEEAFQKLKVFLASPPILTRPEQGKTLYLYLAVSEKALSSALVQEVGGEEKLVYFVSITLRGAETRYQKIERLCLAVSVELSEFDITYIPRGPIKSQALADFVLEMTDPPSEGETHPWTLSVDGSSNLRGSGAGVVLEGHEGVLIEQSLQFAFKASNNQAEYEALIAGMKLAKEMEVQELKVQSDSQLVANQVSDEFQTKDPQLAKYLEKVKGMSKQFSMFELTYVPRKQNARADLLAKLASTKKPGNHHTVIQETLKSPSINETEIAMVVEEEDWQSRIIRYLRMDALPLARDEAAKVKKMSAWYTLVGDKLYKRAFSAPMLLSLAGNVMRAGFYWPNRHDDAARHVSTYDRCQLYSNLHHAPGEPLKSVLSPWPFYMWGVDILGPFPISTAQARWIIVAVDYFTKWVEVEPISSGISSEQENNAALEESLDLLPKLREKAHFIEFYTKQRAARRYNTRVIPRKFKEGDLVLKRPMGRDKGGKIAANWEGPFRVQEAFEGGAYKLETMEGETLPRTWNVANLRFYYS
ncbi:hypothetical protein TSUD_401250 [Trifolium subterraneum]|uniref:RNase H type-1 domain-containing protein n=1 Tax=Trifolium subterraneum TaxID=3900 RepID=A0A2Z6PBA0_TRISU|nr:hypothetical protein TSUD_401250 [Trifolium subterraneum]